MAFLFVEVALDKAVAEATAQRKSEHEEFLTSQSENQACTQLIEKAKNVPGVEGGVCWLLGGL